MVIEIKGIGFPNKGAELMLAAIIAELSQAQKGLRFVVDPNPARDNRERFRLARKVLPSRGVPDRLLALLPSGLLNLFGQVKKDDIGVILDSSGFAYGDHWGYEKAHVRLAADIAGWKSQGKKIILLPQAFGPFRDERLREAMKQIVDNADLVWARDPESLGYLQEIATSTHNLRLAPDLTLGFKVDAGYPPEKFAGRVCIIPNEKMLNATEEATAERYLQFLGNVISTLRCQGERPFLLSHAGEDDLELIHELERQGLEFDSVVESDPIAIKRIIGQCSGVISSRYHGLVNALSHGVPSIAVGWSHKYETLLSDFGIAEHVIDVNVSVNDLPARLRAITDSNRRAASAHRIRDRAAIQAEQVEAMWTEVKEIIFS